VGEFDRALEIDYPPSGCADAGITNEKYLAYIGLLQRTYSSIAGPRPYDLIYARVGGVTVVSERELTFSLTLDRAVYTANLMPPVDPLTSVPRMTARLTLRNTQEQPVRLTFPSGQIFDLAVRNAGGDVVLSWSANKVFPQVVTTIEVGPGEKNWVLEMQLADANGRPLPEGRYTAEGWLATTGGKRYAATAGFEIRHVF
jgi:hypothetical protein